MLKRLFGIFTKRFNSQQKFNPSQIADPVAMEIAWTPIAKASASFRTHRLVRVASQRIEIRSSIENWIFSGFFLLAGILLIAYTFPAIGNLILVFPTIGRLIK